MKYNNLEDEEVKKVNCKCPCGYKFSCNRTNFSKVVCPWCGRVAKL